MINNKISVYIRYETFWFQYPNDYHTGMQPKHPVFKLRFWWVTWRCLIHESLDLASVGQHNLHWRSHPSKSHYKHYASRYFLLGVFMFMWIRDKMSFSYLFIHHYLVKPLQATSYSGCGYEMDNTLLNT